MSIAGGPGSVGAEEKRCGSEGRGIPAVDPLPRQALAEKHESKRYGSSSAHPRSACLSLSHTTSYGSCAGACLVTPG